MKIYKFLLDTNLNNTNTNIPNNTILSYVENYSTVVHNHNSIFSKYLKGLNNKNNCLIYLYLIY